MRVVVTGGIACGKSRFAEALRRLGCETLDADDIVHELVPDEERRRLAKVAFRDASVLKALEKRLHPLVEKRFEEWFEESVPGAWCLVPRAGDVAMREQRRTGHEQRRTGHEQRGTPRIAIIPLLFEVKWERKYDIICAVICSKEKQVERMMHRRGLTRHEAEERLAAQLPVEYKAENSHYVIHNDGSEEDLERQAAQFVAWLKDKEKEENE